MLSIKNNNGKVQYEYEPAASNAALSSASDVVKALPYLYVNDRHKHKKNWMLKNRKLIIELYDLFAQFIKKLSMPNFDIHYYPHHLMKSLVDFLYATRS